MNPAQRAKRLQAHNLRCQGLTYRQIGQRMHCTHSTAAQYVRDFEGNRLEIIESLASDLLVHSVAALQQPDPDLHARHITAARELRLLVNSLDQVADRRQKRQRRVAMEEEADALKNLEALEELYMAMHENGIDDLTPYLTDPEAFRTEHFQQPLSQTPSQTSPSGGGAPKGRRGPTATTAKAAPSPTTPVQPQPKPVHKQTESAQNRPTSNKPERKSPNRPPVQAPPRPKRKKPRPNSRTQQRSQPQFSIADPLPPPNNRRELPPDDPLVRRLFADWNRR